MAAFLFGALVVAIAAFVFAWLTRPPSSPPPREEHRPDPNSLAALFDLRIGDIVQYLDEDWIVESKLTYNDDGFVWVEYLLQWSDRIAWLAVEEDDRIETCLLYPVSDLDISGTPPNSLTYHGDTYTLGESGNANMTRLTLTGQRTAERCRYYDYAGPQDQVLAIEDWDGQREVTAGQQIPPRSLRILPGDGTSVYRQ